jgi:hypothetical protein
MMTEVIGYIKIDSSAPAETPTTDIEAVWSDTGYTVA